MMTKSLRTPTKNRNANKASAIFSRGRTRPRSLIKIGFRSSLLLILILASMTKAYFGANATKCYLCLFQLARCTNPLDCYNQPDTCSNTNFSPLYSQTLDCEFGCEQYVITDATGSIVVWHRGCASERSPKSSYICFSRHIYFLRHDQCWCHTDYCNSNSGTAPNKLLIFTLIILVTSYLTFRALNWAPLQNEIRLIE